MNLIDFRKSIGHSPLDGVLKNLKVSHVGDRDEGRAKVVRHQKVRAQFGLGLDDGRVAGQEVDVVSGDRRPVQADVWPGGRVGGGQHDGRSIRKFSSGFINWDRA